MNAEILVRQLGQLGQDLDAGVTELGRMEEASVQAEGNYRAKEYALDYATDKAFLDANGSVEMRKAIARTCVESYSVDSREAYTQWQQAKAKVRVQQQHLSAIHKRIDVGRSLLSREKALIGLAGMGET